MSNPIIHIGFIKVYEFQGWLFEYDRNKPFGPWPLKRNFEPRRRAGNKFYGMFGQFQDLTEKQQERYRVS